MTGTWINVATVLAGGTLGSVVGSRFSSDLRRTLMHVIGLTTLVIGLQRALGAENVLILLGSAAVGGVIGELLRIEAGLQWVGDRLQATFARPPQPQPSPQPSPKGRGSTTPHPPSSNPQLPGAVPVSEGFLTASLIFCVGPLTILGSFEDGLTGAYQTLAVKATLDGITAALLASSLGWGVLLAAGTVLAYQGALTLGASALRGLLTDAAIAEMTAAGGLLILGIGLNILELSRIRVGNLLPALVVAPALATFFGARGG